MSTKAITDKQAHDRPLTDSLQGPESAPSVLREDEPTVARALGTFGAALTIFGGVALVLNVYRNQPVRVGPGWASMALALGIMGLLFHAAFDRDIQFRRIYGAFGAILFVFGVFLCLLPYPQKMGDQFKLGLPLIGLALLFLTIFLRHETDLFLRQLGQLGIGGAGMVMAILGLAGSSLRTEFLLPYGLLLAITGLVYLGAFIVIRTTSDDLGYRIGLGTGAVGLLVFLLALGRSFLPPLFYAWKWTNTPPAGYAVPAGLLLMVFGLAYFAVAVLLTSESRLVVLTRRELAAFFYSPIAYIILLAFTLATWGAFATFVDALMDKRFVVIEPIVRSLVWQIVPIIIIICGIPALTMRLLSEEKRSGTLEVLLTAPVEETTVVLSKFLAAFVMYLIIWLPFGLFLIALRLGSGQPFDYRPLFSFAVALLVTGANFMGMGLFFSSLTRNQIASFVLTFAGMLILTAVALIRWQVYEGALSETAENSETWNVILNHLSFLDVWRNTLDGKLVLKHLLFPFTMTFLWLFMSVKVLEARKWAG
jgi:ABC-type transport system involved in multi-copper enzyme maturation permease subunit